MTIQIYEQPEHEQKSGGLSSSTCQEMSPLTVKTVSHNDKTSLCALKNGHHQQTISIKKR